MAESEEDLKSLLMKVKKESEKGSLKLKKNWQNVRALYIKSTMGKPQRLY